MSYSFNVLKRRTVLCVLVHACVCLSVFVSAAWFVRVRLLWCLNKHSAQKIPKWLFVYHRVCVRVSEWEGSGAADLLTCVFVLLIPLFWECCGGQEVRIMERAEECSVFVLQSLSNHHTAAETRRTFTSWNTSLTRSRSPSNTLA